MTRPREFSTGQFLRICVTAVFAVSPVTVFGAESVDYDREVRPILSDKCFRCHGPDEAARESGLRLDVREAALVAAESGEIAIVPGKPEASRLLTRITSTDESEVMPPPEINKPLTEAEKDVLRRWISEGADYEQHWSFVPVRRPPVPEAPANGWARNEIDHFVAARLAASELAPSPEATRETLIRRLTFDLTGLPPTPEEIDDFLADKSGNAYDKVVSRLLSSPHFGERMAVDWLDAARYADTHGFHIDSGRDMTHWREWVIRAFNDNKPFDEFTVEQLAGDLLPNATLNQKIASGFNRNHMINYEGGAIPEEYHAVYIIDRVNTLGTVWLGLTVGCAQCHDHKYDPISQREFYGLYAFFHNVPEKGLDGIKGNAAPFLTLPTKEQEQRVAAIQTEIAQGTERLNAARPDLDEAQSRWEEGFAASNSQEWTPATRPLDSGTTNVTSAAGAATKLLDDQSVLLSGADAVHDTYTIRFEVSGDKPISALRLDAIPDDSLPGRGPGRFDNGNFVLSDVRVEVQPVAGAANDAANAPVKIRSVTADYSQPDYSVNAAIDADPKTGWAIYPAIGKPHHATFELETPITCKEPQQVTVTLDFQSNWGRHSIGRFRVAYTTAGAVRSPDSLPENIRKVLATEREKRSDGDRDQLRKHYRGEVSEELRPVASQNKKLEEELKKLQEAIPTAMVMEEMSAPRDTFILVRGQYDKKGEKVSAIVPAMLPPLSEGAPSNRLGLAQWLVAPNHPLTSRVTVNRYWQMFFGAGLVETTEDFGTQGAVPTHPELLDWLAAEFISGWDVKKLVRLIVTSSTYRQASAVPRDAYERDPENQLLGRGSRFRLQAEFIRDQALALSGLLDGRIGGQSVSPYQPVGLWEELMSREDNDRFTAQKYVQSHGADLYRRTMYTFWKRTCPPPTLATFDAPDRETCTVRRARTNTPLQALILLNDPTYLEASRKMAERVLGSDGGDSPSSKLAFAFRLATARQPSERELAALDRLLDAQRLEFKAHQDAAEKLVAIGESKRNESLDVVELAAWATVCSAILNLDETVTRN